MRIISARIQGFRNLRSSEIDFAPRVNLVLGPNGAGKTNFLEALSFPALGRSHRGNRQEELIAFGEEAFHVRLRVDGGEAKPIEFDIGLERGGTRRIRVDGVKVTRLADLVGRLSTVFFCPASVTLVRGGPQHRRQFVDRGMAELDREFLAQLTQFQRTIRQKAGLLREIRNGQRPFGEGRRELHAWNRELAGQAACICRGRQRYAELIGPFAASRQGALTGSGEPLEFLYRPSLESVVEKRVTEEKKPVSVEDLAEEIFREIDYIGDLEMRRGRPLLGPQLDDFEIRLAGVDQRTFGSQGETRTVAISLILAHSDVLYQQRQERPVLFFDDIFSELDGDRARRLQEMTSRDHQIFIATARPGDVAGWQPEEVRIWQVRAGKLTPTETIA